MPTRNVNVSTKENPYGTSEGQDISSIGESMWRRWYRLGKPRATFGDTNFNTGSFSSSYTIKDATDTGKAFTANLGHELLIQRLTISTDVDANVKINIYTGIFNPYSPASTVPAQSTIPIQVFLKAGTPWDWYPDGSVSLVKGRINQEKGTGASITPMNNEGTITVSAQGASASGNIYFSISGVEIARGDL